MEHLTSWPLCPHLASGICMHHSVGDPGSPLSHQLPPARPAFSGAQGLGHLQVAVIQLGEPQGHPMSELTTQNRKVGAGTEGK